MRASRTTVLFRVAAGLGLVAFVTASPGLALADSQGSSVTSTNTETIQTYMNADGKISDSKLYEQLTATGNGNVTLDNPVDSNGLRNIDGFGGLSPRNGVLAQHFDVNGVSRSRTVSNYDSSKLPLSLTVHYELDGKPVSADDLVGATGDVKVSYTVKNLTAKPEALTFDDGLGNAKTATVNVAIPIVGTMVFDLPDNFSQVRSVAASMGGDGHGGTQMEYVVTLFKPIGTNTETFGYTAHLTNGLVPPVSFTAVPVDPLTNPTFAAGSTSYKSGAKSGQQLAAGATTINTNLLKLRDGAGQLLAGLIKLSTGADQLHTGLATQAAPGARLLADGSMQLNGGLAKIDTGADQLAAGAHKASAGGHKLAAGAHQLSGGLSQAKGGTNQLDSGAHQLATGQKQLEAGLTTLYNGIDKLPQSVQHQLATNQDYQSLLGALVLAVNGIGTPADPPTGHTLLAGINAIQDGLRAPGTTDCAVALQGGTPTNCGALDGVDTIAGLINATRTNGINAGDGVDSIAELKAAILQIGQVPACASDPTCAGTVSATATALGNTLDGDLQKVAGNLTAITGQVDARLLANGAGLDQIRAGLYNGDPTNCQAAQATPTKSDDCGIEQALLAVHAGIPQLVSTLTGELRAQLIAGLGQPTKGCNPKKTLRCAARALSNGGAKLADGIDQLRAGVLLLSAGGVKLSNGAGQLSTGLGQLDAGTQKLSGGTAKALDGSAQLATGAHQLSGGLDSAATGSGQLADGLDQAKAGAPKLKNGANQLSKKGVVKLVAAGQATAQQYGRLYAVLAEGAHLAHTDGMAYGAPAGSLGLTAYDFELNGSNGQGSRNVVRLLGAVVLGGLGLGAFALRRRSLGFLPSA
jgi:putative membrane protein